VYVILTKEEPIALKYKALCFLISLNYIQYIKYSYEKDFTLLPTDIHISFFPSGKC
jgi:hypothetical protein